MAAEVKLVKVTYQQSRLEFFKKQLDKATRSMNYHVERKHHPYICAEKGEIVSFYEWAVAMAEKQLAYIAGLRDMSSAVIEAIGQLGGK